MKEVFYFSHDYNSRNDPKIQKVLMKLGQAGKGVYWDIVEMLYENGGYLDLSECESYAFALRTDLNCITSLIKDFGLFENDGLKFWSNSVLDRLERRALKSQKAKQSALERWKKPVSDANALNNDANALRDECESNAIKESKVKDNKVKDNIEEKAVSDEPAPPIKKNTLEAKKQKALEVAAATFHGAGCTYSKEFKKIWIDLCFSPKQRTKEPDTLQKILKKLMTYNESYAITLCEAAILNNTQGVTYPDTDKKFQEFIKNTNNGKNNNTSVRTQPQGGDFGKL